MPESFEFSEVVPGEKWEDYHLGKELYAMITYKEGLYTYAIFDGLRAIKQVQELHESIRVGACTDRMECERACNDFLNDYKRNS